MNTQKINDSIVNDFFEDHPTLKVIDYSDNCVLAYSKKSNKMFYSYRVTDDLSFCFNMLCEVGQNYVSWFTEAIENNKLNIVQFETESDYYDKLMDETNSI